MLLVAKEMHVENLGFHWNPLMWQDTKCGGKKCFFCIIARLGELGSCSTLEHLICVDDATFVKGTNTFLLWGAMNLGKVMKKVCEMGREANGLTKDLF